MHYSKAQKNTLKWREVHNYISPRGNVDEKTGAYDVLLLTNSSKRDTKVN